VNAYTDPDVPAPGAARFYLVAGVNAAGAGTLGHDTGGSERLPSAPCP
jgi:hypothetical protein